MSKPQKMTKETPRRKRRYFKTNPWIILGAVAAFYVILSILDRIPSFQPIADSLWFWIVHGLLLDALILFFAFFHISAKNMPNEGRAAMVLGAILLWLSLLPERWTLIAHVLITFTQIFLITLSQIRRPGYSGPMIVTALSLLTVIWDGLNCSFQNHPNGIHFWQVSLIAAVAAGMVYALLLHREILKLKDNRRSERIALLIGVVAVFFFVTSFSAGNLNRALDDSEPMVVQAKITDADTSTSRAGTSYYLYLDVPEGNLQMSVEEWDYKALKDAGYATLLYYQGAFGDPYYYLESPAQ